MKRASIAIFLFWCFSPLEAQSLRECLSIARDNNVDVKVADLQVERATRMEKTAFDLEKAELSLSQDPTTGGSPDNALTLSQKFDLPGKGKESSAPY